MSKNSTNIAEELNKTSEPVIMTTPLNFIAAAGSASSNTSFSKLHDTCFQDSTSRKTNYVGIK